MLAAGFGAWTDAVVAVRAIGREGARGYGQRRRSGHHPVTFAQVKWHMAVQAGAYCKPSAQPTLVRTQHLPPPAKTALGLRKRGPVGRFLLVTTPCIRMCHRGSMRSSGYGHIADSVRAKRAVRITARFADPRPFCPVARAPDCSPDWLMPRIPVGRFFAVLLAPGGGLALFVPAAGAGCRISPRYLIEAPQREGDRVCVAATGMEDQNGAVASGAVPGSGRRGEPRRHAAWVPGVPGQGLNPAERVMYLSRTGDGPVMYLSYTYAGGAPDYEAAMLACGRCERCGPGG